MIRVRGESRRNSSTSRFQRRHESGSSPVQENNGKHRIRSSFWLLLYLNSEFYSSELYHHVTSRFSNVPFSNILHAVMPPRHMSSAGQLHTNFIYHYLRLRGYSCPETKSCSFHFLVTSKCQLLNWSIPQSRLIWGICLYVTQHTLPKSICRGCTVRLASRPIRR